MLEPALGPVSPNSGQAPLTEPPEPYPQPPMRRKTNSRIPRPYRQSSQYWTPTHQWVGTNLEISWALAQPPAGRQQPQDHLSLTSSIIRNQINIYSSSLETSVNQTIIDSFIACNVGERHRATRADTHCWWCVTGTVNSKNNLMNLSKVKDLYITQSSIFLPNHTP